MRHVALKIFCWNIHKKRNKYTINMIAVGKITNKQIDRELLNQTQIHTVEDMLMYPLGSLNIVDNMTVCM